MFMRRDSLIFGYGMENFLYIKKLDNALLVVSVGTRYRSYCRCLLLPRAKNKKTGVYFSH